jgi:uroporphyrin-III C-methyltransferase
MTDWRDKSAEMKPGEVWLVGAGPAIPGLLTLHAANALARPT